MNWGIESLGILAGILIYGAMFIKRLLWIKILLFLGAVLFFIYGILLSLPAVITVNSFGMLFGMYGIIQADKAERRTE